MKVPAIERFRFAPAMNGVIRPEALRGANPALANKFAEMMKAGSTSPDLPVDGSPGETADGPSSYLLARYLRA